MGVSKYENDELTDYGEGFQSGVIFTLLVVFILSAVAAIAHQVGKEGRDRVEQQAEATAEKDG